MGLDDKQGFERRTSLILLQYWNALRNDRDFPKPDEVDPAQLSLVWPHCFMIEIKKSKKSTDYDFTYLGPDLLHAYNSGPLDKFNGKMVSPDAKLTAHLFEEVMASKDPMLDEGEYKNPSGSLVLFRQALMPLGAKSKSVDAILGGAWYKLQDA